MKGQAISERRIQKVDTYMKLFVRAGNRFAERLRAAPSDDGTLQRKSFVQLLIIRKMYVRAMKDVYADALQAKRKLERERRKLGKPHYKHRLYKGLIKKMDPVKKSIDENQKWIAVTIAEMESKGVVLTPNELQTALSIHGHGREQGVVFM